MISFENYKSVTIINNRKFLYYSMKTHKACSGCGENKPVDQYNVNRQGKRGPIYFGKCKSCLSVDSNCGFEEWYWMVAAHHVSTSKREHGPAAIFILSTQIINQKKFRRNSERKSKNILSTCKMT